MGCNRAQQCLLALADSLCKQFCYPLTTLLFYTTHAQRKLLDASLGFSAGVMLAASYWSLLAPAIEMAEESGDYGEVNRDFVTFLSLPPSPPLPFLFYAALSTSTAGICSVATALQPVDTEAGVSRVD
jgi:zinc transporter ZupT